MYMIHTDKLNNEDKVRISKDYIIPKIINDFSLDKDDIIFNDDILKYIISSYSQEEGVRNLKRAYETILSKINLMKITYNKDIEENMDNIENIENNGINNLDKNEDKLFNFLNKKELKFPLIMTREIIDKLIEDKSRSNIPFMMYF